MDDAAIVQTVRRHADRVDIETAALRLLETIDPGVRALEPLEKWSRHEVDLPETYPTGV
jgi:hypothetical protein